jgi:hypothetical protein
MKILRDYQEDNANKLTEIIKNNRLAYFSAEVRTGKTATALDVARQLGCKKVLFVTKKKAIDSIEADYVDFNFKFVLQVINYESLHKVLERDFDLVILDEAHSLGAFAKPSNRTKRARAICTDLPILYLSGTPTPETYSQIYHQLWVSSYSPFAKYTNFYKWAREYVNIKQIMINGRLMNDYKTAKVREIKEVINPIMLSYSQKQAGFESQVNETILIVRMDASTYRMADKLAKDLVIEGRTGTVLGDTPTKLMQKLHQIYSGTVKMECGGSVAFDLSKAAYIKGYFVGKKIAIFYKFKAELELLTTMFGDKLCTDISEFNATDKNIALQIVSGREGTNLSAADALVFFNIDFSATSYWQGRDRMTTKDRAVNNVYWIFSEGGIEQKIYKSVEKKKNFTVSHFVKHYK